MFTQYFFKQAQIWEGRRLIMYDINGTFSIEGLVEFTVIFGLRRIMYVSIS